MTAMPQVAVGLRAGTVVVIRSRRWSSPPTETRWLRANLSNRFPPSIRRPLKATVNNLPATLGRQRFAKQGNTPINSTSLPTIRRIRKG